MATENIDQDLLDNGIKEPANADIEQEYNSSINEMGTDPSKANIARVLRLLYTSYRTVSGNDRILRKMYKETKNKLIEQMKVNKTISDNQKEEMRNFETMSQKYNELLKAQIQAKEDIQKLKEEKNEFTISEKQEPEIDEGVLQELRISNEQLSSELNEAKIKLNENNKELNQMKKEYNALVKLKNELNTAKIELENKRAEEASLFKTDLETKDNEIKHVKELSEKRKKDFDEKEKEFNEAKTELDKKTNDLDGIRKKIDNLNAEYRKLGVENENLLKRIDRINNEKKVIIEREHESNDLLKKTTEDRDKIQKLADQNENTIKEKIRYIDNVNKRIEEKNLEITRQKGDIAILTKNLAGCKKEIEERKLEIEKELRSIEKTEGILKKKIEENEKKDKEYTEMNESYKKAMSNLDKNKKELNELEKIYRELERARNKSTEENTKLKNKIDHLLEDIRLGDNRVQELQKKVAEYEKKMKMQREVYDAVRRDKNLYFKNLIETQDDLVERQNLLQFNKKEI